MYMSGVRADGKIVDPLTGNILFLNGERITRDDILRLYATHGIQIVHLTVDGEARTFEFGIELYDQVE
jgi:hypothetical protein